LEDIMESLLSVGQDVLIMVIGLLVRFLVAVIGFAVLLVPIVLLMAAWQKLSSVRDRATGLAQAGSVKWLRQAHYAPWHTWLAPAEAGLARLGMDAIAGRILGGITGIEIAAPGTRLRAGEALARVSLGTRTATLRSPADGLVVAINADAERSPQVLHRDPYHRGWLALIAPSPDSYRTLRTGEPARLWLADEDKRLQLAFEHSLGFAAADGGDLVAPLQGLLDDEQWTELTGQFL
jgi:glycine cleavage system H protein